MNLNPPLREVQAELDASTMVDIQSADIEFRHCYRRATLARQSFETASVTTGIEES
jgi:hypothetical protein